MFKNNKMKRSLGYIVLVLGVVVGTLFSSVAIAAASNFILSGKVYRPDGKPVSTVVSIWKDDYQFGDAVETDASGFYRCDLTAAGPGRYYVLAIAPEGAQYFDADPVIFDTESSPLPFDLHFAPVGIVTGKVTGTDGLPITNVVVWFQNILTNDYYVANSPDPSGTYWVFVPPGAYNLEFEYEYNQVSRTEYLSDVSVGANMTLANIDKQLACPGDPKPATISGWVTDLSGKGLSGVTVVFDNYRDWNALVYYAGSTTTDANGRYVLMPRHIAYPGAPLQASSKPAQISGALHFSKEGFATKDYPRTVVLIGGQDVPNIDYAMRTPDVAIMVMFNARGGSAVASKGMAVGAPLGALPVTTRTGYTFNGWYTAPSGGSKVTATYKPSDDILLYAQWTAKKHTLKYYNGSTLLKSVSASYGSKLSASYAPAKTGYTFAGWYSAKTGGAKVETVTKNQSVYARYTIKKYTVKYYSGSTLLTTASVKYKGAPMAGPPKTGYTFAGWYSAKTGGSKVTAITKSQTLYARYSIKKSQE